MKNPKYSLDWIRIQNVSRSIKRGQVLTGFQSKGLPLEDGCIRMDVKRGADGETIHLLVKVGRERVENALNAFKDGIELDCAIYRVSRSPANKGEIISGNFIQI